MTQHSNNTVKVWDPLIRVFHWSLASFFIIAYLTEGEVMPLHAYAGYGIVALVAFRLIWGMIGTHHARFRNFVTGPGTTVNYLKDIAQGKAKRFIGHNPAGAAMIVALLLMVTLTAFSGMALLSVDGEGPLANTFFATMKEHDLKEVHELFANLTVLLVALHVAGVIASSWLHKENLVRAMLNGKKTSDHSSQ
ncbi:cytochrome b/b6 domain-containing protein [Gynuella sunshinyii]|uniref:Cytochrome b n=1 Tax=Gynuella sunshinyii YC6258 TaxID=1445510 RepID=A0A0C5VKA8_9GAMM|nr:cytochrome b/b6 domain-containing protein [Gynuella sunshinyii]AJQ93808.1 cytochrome b [Gynuella sunshinyii YC6258]